MRRRRIIYKKIKDLAQLLLTMGNLEKTLGFKKTQKEK